VRSPARQTLPLPQRALAAIPKRSLVICIPSDARGSILRDCNHLWRGGFLKDTGAQIKAAFAGIICSAPFLKPLPFERRERLVEVRVWKVCPANYFALLGLRGKAIRTRKKYRN
jgi:hypothetical protein